MRRPTLLLLTVATASVLSCSDVPIAPRPGAITVSGRITDRDGPPLAGVYLYFSSEAPGGSYSNAPTDADGRYSLRLSEGVYRVDIVPGIPRGYPLVELRGVVVGASGATIDYRYEGVRVSGSVVGPSGQALTAASVGVYRTAGGDHVATSGAADGSYSLLIPAGVYSFSASSGGVDGVPRLAWNDVPVASDTTIDVALTGHEVTVTATFAGATPMPGAGVLASNPSVVAGAATGPNGVATLYLPAGDYTIQATPVPRNIVGPLTITRSVAADDAVSLDFTGPMWSMAIRRASDGALLTGAEVSLDDFEGGYAVAETDAFGQCELFVRAGVGYNLRAFWYEGGAYVSAMVPNLHSAADTTFDLSVTPQSP